MRIAIIGAGRVGTALGTGWSGAGHDVVYGVRDPGDAERHGSRAVDPPVDAVTGADVVAITLPWAAVHDVAREIDVATAVVVDATNPLAANARELQGHPDLSGAELLADWLGSDRVVKAFNTTGSANMTNPRYPGGTPLMPVASDDAEAKAVVLGLATELGFEALDAGPLSAAADLEHLAMIWIRLAYQLGQGPDIAFSLLRR